ncbi:MAG: hypothetical protein HDT46_07540 [Ruminococcaceae bacterium]|nr:hypothetical protein [Oscillospiraceae bacterium]
MNSTVLPAVYAETVDEKNAVSSNTQMAYLGDILTLNAYYDAETLRIYSEMCITYAEKMPEIYCSYDNENFVLTEASEENKYSFAPDVNSEEVYVKAVQILADGSVLTSDIKTVNISEATIVTTAYYDDDNYLGYIQDAHLAEPIAVIPRTYFPSGFAEMIYLYPAGSYFSQTGKECECHKNNCNIYGGCDCISFDNSIQCMGFAKLAYKCLHNKSFSDPQDLIILGGTVGKPNHDPNADPNDDSIQFTAELAKSLFMDTSHHNLGTYIRVRPTKTFYLDHRNDHSIAIINTDVRGLTVYHANYDGKCLVSYQYYTWENFVQAFPRIYHYVK